MYKQCKIKKGDVFSICWIPDVSAKVGHKITVSGFAEDGDIWEVVEIYSKQPEEYIREYKDDYRKSFPSLKK